MRYLGLDYGTKTLGVSVSDSTALIATTLRTIRYENKEGLFKELKKIIEEYRITEAVLGLPLNMNGTSSLRSEETLIFKKELEETLGLIVHTQDERLSTCEAEKFLISGNVRRGDRKKVIDTMAATIILQSFLDRIKR